MMRWAFAIVLASALVGCNRAPEASPTFNKDVAPIVFQHCLPCHREGQPVPFTLAAYSDLRSRAQAIARVTQSRKMPPWLPDPGEPAFFGERRLRDDQIETIRRWVEAGAPEGDPDDLPKVPTWPAGWELGQPDLVVTLPRPFVLKPGAHDAYRNLVLPVTIPADRFVRAVEFRPDGAPVHHAVIRVDRERVSRANDGVDGQPGFEGMLAYEVQDPGGHFIGWAPGRGPIISPERMPWRLDRGSDLVAELHLLPGEGPIPVQPSVGLFFTDTPPQHEPVMLFMGSKTIDIPAGASNHAIEESYLLPVDADVLSIYPHAHYLGKEMHVRATLPSGSSKTLLHIRQWSFHWQQDYKYLTPVPLPRGTTITMRFTYDNSEANRANPHLPPRRVMWGLQSSDEMGNIGLQFLPRSKADAEVLLKSFAEREALENIAGAEMRIRHVPNDAENYRELGMSLIQVGRFAEAVGHLERAVALDPKSASAHNHLGGALLALGRIQDGLVNIRRASALAPRDAHLHFNVGKVLMGMDQLAAAAAEFERALALNPDLAAAHHNLGVVRFAQNRMPAALEHLGRAVELAPTSASAHSDLGGALAQVGRFEEALVYLRRALELDPGYAPARDNLSRLESLQKR